ncbi:hypothetical protein P43SY_001040 [Pythium insidiosum]|uniref:Uncharacterized protein n=1 Tax=Pythium insidiosum TaxID=114742 RepID=A0AAD5LBD8_PYTIN|nr:hypothetical protein P43SY_001040 [Pythium insidiosum]KAJ0397168.1 hypothetical protein ATCC90586_001710 [Pythium insidiosum]
MFPQALTAGRSMPKMESTTMNMAKLTVESSTASLVSQPSPTSTIGDASPGAMMRVTGKRSLRESERPAPVSVSVSPHAPLCHQSLDVSTVSSLGRELMEKKRTMLNAALAEERSPRPDGTLKGSDEDSDNSSKVKAIKMSPIEDIKKEALTEEDILKRKAQRRLQNQAFGWSFDFWSDESRYYVKSHKFFRGINAHDLAMRFHYVDVAKYIATFPEVKEKTVLKDLGNHIRIVQTVKQLPGKPVAASVTYSFAAKDEDFPGERMQHERQLMGGK